MLYAFTVRLLIVTSVEAEARAIGVIENASIVVSGIGRTNAAAATTEVIVRSWNRGGTPFDAVINAGIAGALPGSGLNIGECLVASQCIYAEEGIVTSKGFATLQAMGFSLGDFEGNAVPVDEELLDLLGSEFPIGPIATVATCSGTKDAAAEIVRRTGGALAEAMEGAAVVHAARRLKVPAIEIRTISNTTGDRASQQWDIAGAMTALGEAMRRVGKSLSA
jgi:futalosine hydrolase